MIFSPDLLTSILWLFFILVNGKQAEEKLTFLPDLFTCIFWLLFILVNDKLAEKKWASVFARLFTSITDENKQGWLNSLASFLAYLCLQNFCFHCSRKILLYFVLQSFIVFLPDIREGETLDIPCEIESGSFHVWVLSLLHNIPECPEFSQTFTSVSI